MFKLFVCTMESETLYKSVACWDTRNVSSWIKGLDKTLCCYGPYFEAHQICGADLLKMTRAQLYYLKVEPVGHQELILEGVELLGALEKSLTQNSTIWLAGNLSKKASQLTNALTSVNKGSDEVDDKLILRCKELGGGVMMAAKNLVSWSDRHPTNLISDYVVFRQDVLRNALELSCLMQTGSFGGSLSQQALGACQGLLKLTRSIVTPHNLSSVASVQRLLEVKLRPKGNTGLGISVKKTKQGALLITQIVQGSPADVSRVRVGAEMVQINDQNVVGWAVANVVDVLKASCHEVTLVLQVASDDGDLDVVSPASPNEECLVTPKETSPASSSERSLVTPTTPLSPVTPLTPTMPVLAMGVPKDFSGEETSSDDRSPTSPHKTSPAPPRKASPTPPQKTNSPTKQATSYTKHPPTLEMLRGISSSLQDVTGTNQTKQSVPQCREEVDENGKSRSVWYNLDPPPLSSPSLSHTAHVVGPFEKRLHARTSSDPSSPNPTKAGPSVEYPHVAYRTAVVGGVVIRIPITGDEKAAGSKNPNKKKTKKVHLDIPAAGKITKHTDM